MLVKIQLPHTIALAENPILFGFRSYNAFATPGVVAKYYFEFTGYPALGQAWILEYAGHIYTFEFVQNPVNNPLHLNAGFTGIGLPTLVTYMQQVINQINQHYDFSTDFLITLDNVTGPYRICFTARQAGEAYNLTSSGTAPVQTIVGWNTQGVDPEPRAFYGIFCQCFIEDDLAGEDLLNVNEAGEVFYNVSSYLKANINSSFIWPVMSLLANRTDLLKRYHVRYADRYGIPAAINKLKSTDGILTYALPGGIGYEQQNLFEAQNNNFWNDLQYTKRFLTNKPKSIRIKQDQIEKLFFLNHQIITQLHLYIELYFFSDLDVPYIYTLSGVTTTQWKVIEVSFHFLELVETLTPPLDKVYKFVIALAKPDGTLVSERRTYYLDHRAELHQHFFIWRNSLGMYDTDLFTGKYERSVASEKQIYSMTNRYNFTANNPQTQVLQSIETQMVNASTGWIDDVERATWLRELLLSKEVYEVENGVLHPIVITTADVAITTDGKTLHNIHIEYTRAYTDEHFSKSGHISAGFINSWQSAFNQNNPYNPTM